MIRNVKVVQLLLMTGALLAQAACYNQALDRTFGRRYHEIFQLQAGDRPTLAPTATKGEEERRIIAAYYGGFTPANSGGSTQSAAANFQPSQSGAQQQGSSTLDLRSR